MSRLVSLSPLVVLALCVACGDHTRAAPAAAAVASADTMPANLDSLATAIPPAAPETVTPKLAAARVRTEHSASTYPPAPSALMAAVERERSFSRFCYEEFGQKNDPTLAGTVSMAVAVGSAGITDARVSDDQWSSGAGKGVNACLNERAARAWKVNAGAVKPGTYLVQLRFRPT